MLFIAFAGRWANIYSSLFDSFSLLVLSHFIFHLSNVAFMTLLYVLMAACALGGGLSLTSALLDGSRHF